jgi:hypothetical protein
MMILYLGGHVRLGSVRYNSPLFERFQYRLQQYSEHCAILTGTPGPQKRMLAHHRLYVPLIGD